MIHFLSQTIRRHRSSSSSGSDFIFQKGVEILSVDGNGLYALQKPFGVLSHPNTASHCGKINQKKGLFLNSSYCFTTESYYIPGSSSGSSGSNGSMGDSGRFWLINRLDSATSGVILVADNKEVSKAVKKVFKDRHVKKTYCALVFGHLKSKNKSVMWKDAVDVQKGNAVVRMTDTGNLKKRLLNPITAKTNMRGISYNAGSDTHLLELSPLTGYTHQLRYQCSLHGHPIVGDKVYGDFSRNKLFKGRDLSGNSSNTNKNGSSGNNCNSIVSNSYSDSYLRERPQLTSNRNRLYLHSHHIHLEYVHLKQLFTFSATSPLPAEFDLATK